MLPLVSHVANVFNLCSLPGSPALYVQNWFPIGPAVWSHFPGFWIVDLLKTPNCPWDSEGRIVFSLCPFPDESVDVYQIWCQSVQVFDTSPYFWMCDPLTPPMPLGYWGRIIFSLCPFPNESADLYQIWCQSVLPFDSFSRPLNVWPPTPHPKCPLRYWGATWI